MLLTGDMGWEGEMELLRHTKLPEVDLFVAGHHGASSSSSETLLEVIRPEFAAISVGEYNTYGHPGTDTLQRFKDIGAEVYRTDVHSTTTFNMK